MQYGRVWCDVEPARGERKPEEQRVSARDAETRRGETRKDDESRRGSRTAALNAVPSDRQHRLCRGFSFVRFFHS